MNGSAQPSQVGGAGKGGSQPLMWAPVPLVTQARGGEVPSQGEIVDFDEAMGLGSIAEDGSERIFTFHSTQLSDGTRTASVGDRAIFYVVAGHLGRWEASGIVKIPAKEVTGDG